MLVTPGPGSNPTISEATTKTAHRVQSMAFPHRLSGYCSVLQMHFGGITAIPLVALDRPGKPPTLVTRRSEKCLAKLRCSASERDPLEAPAVVAAGKAAHMSVTNNAGLEQACRSGRHARRRPARAIGSSLFERIAKLTGDAPWRKDCVEQQRTAVERTRDV